MAETLTFKTERKRRTVQIDKEVVEMLDADEIDLAGGLALREVLDLVRSSKTREEAAKASKDLKAAMGLLLMVPSKAAEERIERLTDQQRLAVIMGFLTGPDAAHPGPERQP